MLLVGSSNNGRFAHCRMVCECRLNLDRIYIVAVRVVHVLLSVKNEDKPVLVGASNTAGTEPPITSKRPACLLGLSPISRSHIHPLDNNLPRRTFGHVTTPVVHNPDLGQRPRKTH